jgi:carbamoyltransferase
MRHILGISAYYHDAAAALLCDGTIAAAAQEERFSRRKNDPAFPHHAIAACLRQARLTCNDLDAVAFYDKPILKFARLLETSLAVAPRGLRMFADALPSWLSEKLNLRRTIRDEIPDLPAGCPVLFTLHHEAHAASAFFPSPFEEAAILTVDGVGEYATTTIGHGQNNRIHLLQELRFPHSLGLLYSAFTAYCGFRVNSGEYKLMGLAPYGEPRFVSAIYEHLIDLKPDGSFWLNPAYFDFLTRWRMTNDKFDRLFGGPPRPPESALDQRHMDVARSIQIVTEEIMLRLARHARELTGSRRLCLAGGVALNCVANGHIQRSGLFDRLWIQPAAGDAGGALGAALAAWFSQPHATPPARARAEDLMQGAFLGPQFTTGEIRETLQTHRAVFRELPDKELFARTVELLQQEKVVGWFQGRMEFGPRALGNRSILADARSPRIQSELNLKIKQRESFRPFAPIVRLERVSDYFELDQESPYMLLVAPVRESLRCPSRSGAQGLERLHQIRSSIPAVTHVDYSARIQTVNRTQNPRLYQLLLAFEHATGCGVLVNTSFNVRGEPVVGSPDDAYRCFINTAMDYLVIDNFLLARADQPHQHLPLKTELVLD